MKYEYICKNCEHNWSVEQSMKDDAIKQCPKCKKETAQRLVFGGLGFVLKGSGWFDKGGY